MRFAQLIDRARSLSANQIVPFSSEEQLDAERLTTVRFNHLTERAGWGVRLELFVQFAPEQFLPKSWLTPDPWYEIVNAQRAELFAGIAEQRSARTGIDYRVRVTETGAPIGGGIRIVETRPGGYEEAKSLARERRGEWFAGVFEFLTLVGEAEPVHPVLFDAESRKHWHRRLRKRVTRGIDLVDLQASTLAEMERQRRDSIESLQGTAATWDAFLGDYDRKWRADGNPIRVEWLWQRPDGTYAQSNNQPAHAGELYPADNRRGAFTPFPIAWVSFDWECRRIPLLGPTHAYGGVILPPRFILVTPELDRFYSVLFDWSWIRPRFRHRVLPEEYRRIADMLDPTPGPRHDRPTGQIHRTARWSEEATATFRGYWIGKTALFRYRRNYNRPIGLRHVRPLTNVTTPFWKITCGLKGPPIRMPEGQLEDARKSYWNRSSNAGLPEIRTPVDDFIDNARAQRAAQTITEHRSQRVAALPETAKGITNGSKHVVRRPVHSSLQRAG